MNNDTNNEIKAHAPIDFPISPGGSDTLGDTEGHARRRGPTVGGEGATTSIPTDGDAEDTEGHRFARGYMYEDTDDTEGHAFRR